MKTLMINLVVILMAAFTNAQEITELKEAKVGFSPLFSDVERDGDNFSLKVNEAYVMEFEKDPVLFMQNYFDIQEFMNQVKREKYDSYQVSFVSRKGKLKADFNGNGELVRSKSVFKNTLLPEELREKLYRENKGWAMTKNVHITRIGSGRLNQDFYKIRLKNGKEQKNIIFEAPVKASGIVSN